MTTRYRCINASRHSNIKEIQDSSSVSFNPVSWIYIYILRSIYLSASPLCDQHAVRMVGTLSRWFTAVIICNRRACLVCLVSASRWNDCPSLWWLSGRSCRTLKRNLQRSRWGTRNTKDNSPIKVRPVFVIKRKKSLKMQEKISKDYSYAHYT